MMQPERQPSVLLPGKLPRLTNPVYVLRVGWGNVKTVP